MSVDPLGKGKDGTKHTNKIVAALHRGIIPTPAPPAPGVDYWANELAERVAAQYTVDAKIRLLLVELQTTQLVGKGRAVEQLNLILGDKAIPSVQVTEIWQEAKICLSSPDSHVRQQSLLLMAHCIELQLTNLHAWQRVNYYDIIQKHPLGVVELGSLEYALFKLIEGGRNVSEVSGTLLNLLSRWLDFCAVTATESTFDEGECGKYYRAAFFISECVFQFSYSRFLEHDVAAFIQFLCNTIGTSTGMIEVIGKILDIIEVIPRYGGLVPVAAVSNIIGFICAYRSSRLTEQLADRFWEIIQSLLRLDYIAHETMRILENVPAEDPAPGIGRGYTPRHWQKFRIRGALIFLGQFLKAQELTNGLKVELKLWQVLKCIENAIVRHADLNISQGAIDLLAEILASDLILRLTFEDWNIIWDSLGALIREISEVIRAAEYTAEAVSLSSKPSVESQNEDRLINNILRQLEEMVHKFQEFCVTEEYTGSLSRCITFQMTLSKILPDLCDDFILAHYEKFNLCMPAYSNWLSECEVILENFIRDDTKPPKIRVRAIELIAKTSSIVALDEEKPNEDFSKRVITPLFQSLRKEKNGDVSKHLIRLAVTIADSEKVQWGIKVSKALFTCASEQAEPPRLIGAKHTFRNSEATTSSNESVVEPHADIKFEAAKGLVEIFERSLSRDAASLSQKVFVDLVSLVQSPTSDTKVRFEALDVLLRLRADSLYSVYLTDRLPRRHGRIPVLDIPQETPTPPISRTRPWAQIAVAPRSPIRNGIGATLTTYITKNRLKSFDDHVSDDEEDDEGVTTAHQNLSTSDYILPVSRWLDTVIILYRQEKNWDLYYHLVEHFAEQLFDKTFFAACNSAIIRLREILCSQLINSHLPDLENLNTQKRTEVTMRLHKILTILIGYHDIFVKASRDELVRCFQINMGRYNPILTKQCIHSLMVCCHELPKSIARCLSGILQTLSHQITTSSLSVHILEFLIGVGRIKKIHETFTADEFLMVFQVALKFLQHNHATSRDRIQLTDTAARESQYIVHLAYEALTVWFLAVKLENRRTHVHWIVRQLILANDSSGLDDQALVFVDMLERFSFSDSPLKKYPDTVEPEGLAQYKKHWVVGRSVQTAQVVREDGLVKITVRKPASMLVTYMQAEVDFDSDAIRTGRKKLTQAELTTLPSYMITQVHTTDQPPVLLSEDESTLRSIRSLDRTPVVNFHAIGITYVGWGQTTEEEILSNETGSVEYQHFLDMVGTVVRLKGNTEIYHGGLDIEDDQDGTHALFWSDKTTQITFITYTMIPLKKEGDRRLALSNKKRNAANCFVNIIWNDSNEPYALDTIASEFNSNSIVISRHSRSSSETDVIVSSERAPTKEPYFKVKLVQTEGMPEISPIVDEKIISASSLAPFVRSVALNLSIFCQIYIGRQEKSHWVARLDQIRQIRDRALQKRNSDSPAAARGALSPSISNATLSSMGRRIVSVEPKPDLSSQRSEEDQLTQWLNKYDFSKYT